MDKKKTNKSLTKLAFERTGKTFNKKMPFLALLFLIIVASIALGILLPELLILAVPLLILPAVFAFLSINTIIDSNLETDTHSFFALFRKYFSRLFKTGCN